MMRAPAAERQHLTRFLTRHGAPGYFPTTVAAPLRSNLRGALGRRGRCHESVPKPSRPAHGEVQALPTAFTSGPFLSHNAAGVHHRTICVSHDGFGRFSNNLWQAARGHVRRRDHRAGTSGRAEVIAEAAGAKFA